MANSSTDRQLALLLAALTLPLALALPQSLLAANAAGATDAEPPCGAGNLCWTADGGAEYRREKVVLRNLVIYEGGTPLRISAQDAEASTLDFSDSNWTLTGHVEVRLSQGQLTADRATVHFLGGRLSAATAEGKPATFEQQPGTGDAAHANDVTARGHAGTIDYNLVTGEVRLVGDAWLSDGCNETGGERITYNMAQKRVQAQGPESGSGSGRVQGTIRPQCKPSRGSAPAPTSATP